MAANSSSTEESTFQYASGFLEDRFLGQGKFEPTVLFRVDRSSQYVLKFICGKDICESEDVDQVSENIKDKIGNVRHPNVLAYLAYMLHGERKQMGIKMKYMSNGSLYSLMERGVDIPWSVSESILHDVSAGMAYLHTEREDKPVILHENLHLNNVLLTEDFQAKVSDYGLKMVYAMTRNYAQNQQSFEDYKFRAPERMEDISEPNTKATDVYSFGIIVYALLKRSTDPFAPMKEEELKKTLVKGQSVVDSERLSGGHPAVFVEVLDKATEHSPDQRADFEGLNCMLTISDQDRLLNDIDELKRDLLHHPIQPQVPHPRVQSDYVPNSYHASSGSPGFVRSQTWQSQSSQQATDDLDEADCQTQNEDGKSYGYDGTTSQNSTSSRRSKFGSSSSTSGESVHYPPRNEQVGVGEDEEQETCVKRGSQASSRVVLPPSNANGDGGLTDAMRSLGIQPHPSSLNPGIRNGTPSAQQNGAIPAQILHGVQNGTASIPNLPNFHATGAPMTGQQFVSNTVPSYQQNIQSFINGIPAMTNGSGPQIVNVSGESVVLYGENSKIEIVGKRKAGRKPLPLTDADQRTLDSTRPVTQRDIDIVAEHLGKKWRELGRKLRFSKGQLDAFDADYHGMRETIYQMLLQWKQRESTSATVGRLARELESVMKRSVVKKLKA
ncbi:receptor-interacting serine/threonine-protein kinase 1-like [Lineus longissimus]|uniref:receptor-interacting serine/threonine-protein kinase 1-like n=1 Tax=Lineus longissimus TaxID=88925 RepID=UPI002B4C8287